jgi:hypothetical protein
MRPVVVVLLAGCYAPSPATGVECSSNNTCPAGQTCNLATRICDGITPGDGVPPGDDGAQPDAALGPFGAPVPLGELNTSDNEGDPSMTADGLEIYFASNRQGLFSKIFVATRASVSDPFGAPIPLSLNSAADEFGPEISNDGLELYFNRSQFPGSDSDIFRTTRADRQASFGIAQRQASLSDDTRDDRNPTIAPNRLFALIDVALSTTNRDLVYFTRMQPTGAWTRVGIVTELATMVVDASAVFDGSGDTIYFHSNRNGTNELFTATRENKNKPFGTATVIPELGEGIDPWVSPDQRVIVFARGNDLMMATR